MTSQPQPLQATEPSTQQAATPLGEHEIDLDWMQTRAHMRADFDRALGMMGDTGTPLKRLYWWLMPPMQALVWYRISRWLYLRGHVMPARLIFLVSYYVTGAELPPTAAIGPGCVIGHAIGARIYGRVGARFTLWSDANIGGGIVEGEVGGGPGLPCLGNDVTLGSKSVVLGAVRIGDGVKIGPGCIVTRDVPARATVFSPPPRLLLEDPPAPPSNSSNAGGRES